MTAETKDEKQSSDIFIFDNNHPSIKNLNDAVTKIIHLLPILSIAIIFFSWLRMHVYYRFWGINILDFIGLTELLSAMLVDLVSFLLIGITIIFILFACKSLVQKYTDWGAANEKLTGFQVFNFKKKSKPKKWVDNIIYAMLAFIIIFIPIVPFVFLIIYLNDFINFRFLAYECWGVLTTMFFTAMIIGNVFNKKIHIDHFVVLCLLVIMLIGSVEEGSKLAEGFYDNKKYHTTYIEFSNDTIKPIYMKYVVGITDKYIILWDKTFRKPEVRNRSDVKKMVPGILPLSNSTFLSHKN